MTDDEINDITFAILLALDDAGIETYHSAKWGMAVNAVVGPTLITLGISLVEPKLTQKALKQSHAIATYVARELNYGFGQEVMIRMAHQGAYLVVEVPRQDPWRPTLPELNESIKNEVFLGLDTHQVPFYIDLFRRENPGMFGVGRAGSGKTNFMRLVMAQGVALGWSIALIDLKGGGDWRDLQDHADMGVAYDEAEAILLLEKISKISTDRNQGKASADRPLLLVFDEIHRTGKKEQAQLIFADLCSTCRSSNIRILAGSQRAGKEIEARITANLDTRMVGKVQSKTESFNASGVTNAGAESLAGLGDMLISVDGVIKGRLQVPRALPEDVAHLLTKEAEPAKPVKPIELEVEQATPVEPVEQATPVEPVEQATPVEPDESDESDKIETTPPYWGKRNLKAVYKSLEKAYEEKRIELLTSKSRAKMPPWSVVVQAGLWRHRRGEMPSLKQLNEWRKAAKKKTLGAGKRKLVIQIVSDAFTPPAPTPDKHAPTLTTVLSDSESEEG